MKIIVYNQDHILINLVQEISLKVNEEIRKLNFAINNLKHHAIISTIPSYCSIAIKYNPELINFNQLKDLIENINYHSIKLKNGKEHIIPVCYDLTLGEDLDYVCKHSSLSKKQLIRLHTSPSYVIYSLGFVPGFLYLGGLDSQLSIPRKETPNIKVPKGSVGLAGNQTGIYPLETPGGWQLIGQTPIKLFDQNKPKQYQMGDTVRFQEISLSEFKKLQNE